MTVKELIEALKNYQKIHSYTQKCVDFVTHNMVL